MKNNPDAKRFSRYQSVIKVLTAKDSFRKPDIYAVLKEEKKTFIGRVISELVRDGYLVPERKPRNLKYPILNIKF